MCVCVCVYVSTLLQQQEGIVLVPAGLVHGLHLSMLNFESTCGPHPNSFVLYGILALCRL